MTENDETTRAVEEIIYADTEGFWLLMGDIEDKNEPQRREAMMGFLLRAYEKGYESGLRQGGKLMADAVIARVSEQ